MKITIAYVPVLHEGYRRFYERHANADIHYILGSEFLAGRTEIERDVRKLDPTLVFYSLNEHWLRGNRKSVSILDVHMLRHHVAADHEFVLALDDLTREFAEQYLSGKRVTFDTAFLRWHNDNVLSANEVKPDRIIEPLVFGQRMMALAHQEAEKSSDWWRHVGAILGRGDEAILRSYNRHLPHEHIPYMDGDPRALFSRGIQTEISTALHAERGIIAEAARKGISTEGCWLYLSTFPCPPCARLVAMAGIKEVLFDEHSYSTLQTEELLRSMDVTLTQVER